MSVQITTLDNGMRVLSDPMPHVETASVGVWVDVGARYERPLENGLSHLLEHMAFKGTENRSARDIAEEIEAVGGYMNAFTSREHTTFLARVLKEDVGLALDVLADILQNSTFKENELDREKEVILQEIGQTNDTPDDIIFDNLQEVAFPEQSLGRSILGTTERVQAFTSDDLHNYLQKYYKSGAMVVTAAGNVDHDKLVDQVSNLFSQLPDGRTVEFEAGHYEGGSHHLKRDLEQVHVALGLPGVQFDDPHFYAMQVFSTILGGGMSSRLFQEIRENRGLAYNVYSFSSSHVDSGLFGIYAATNARQADEAVQVIADEMKKLIDDVSEKELDRAKAQLKTGLLMSLESTSSRIEQLGRQMLIFGRPLEAQELIEKVDLVDPAMIRDLGLRLLADPLSLTSVGDAQHLSDRETVQGYFS